MKRHMAALRDALLVGPVTKRWTWGTRPVRFENRGPSAHMGRFGGGWDTNIGLQMGRRGIHGTVIINLGRSSLRIDPTPTRKATP